MAQGDQLEQAIAIGVFMAFTAFVVSAAVQRPPSPAAEEGQGGPAGRSAQEKRRPGAATGPGDVSLKRFVRWLGGTCTMTDATSSTQPAPNTSSRDTIALKVICIAGVGIFLAAVAVLLVAFFGVTDPKDRSSLVTTVFNTVVPMFGTWVGTVIAFYFARENYAAAAQQTKDLVQRFGDERLKQIKVQDAWIPVNSIDAIEAEDDSVAFDEVRKKLSSRVSRVPIWNSSKVVRYVIHESVIFEFLTDTAEKRSKALSDAAASGQAAPPEQAPTLKDFLDFKSDGREMRSIVTKIAWVAQTATLADAKAKMEGTPDCQDVFITDSGDAKEPVLGWVTNADIAKKARA